MEIWSKIAFLLGVSYLNRSYTLQTTLHFLEASESEKMTHQGLLLPFYNSSNKKDHYYLKKMAENANVLLDFIFLSFRALRNKADKSHSFYNSQMVTEFAFPLLKHQ